MQRTIITAGLALSLGCLTVLGVGQAQTVAAQQQARAADAQQAAQLQLSRELPATPRDVAGALVDLIGEGSGDMGCILFSPAAATEFATVNHVATCAQAITRLHSQVTDANAYINDVTVPDESAIQEGDRAEVNGCVVNWDGPLAQTPEPSDPGPRPSWMSMQRLDGNGWLITNYRAC